MRRRGAALLLSLALAGCGGDGGLPGPVVDQFVEQCTARGASEDQCRCAIDRLEERFSFTELSSEIARWGEGRRPSRAFLDAIRDCARR